MNASSEIEKILDRWFITEPIYFMTQCMFKITPNETISKFAAANGHLYVNMNYADTLTPQKLEECIKVEYLRILLKHPFKRCNRSFNKHAALVASDCVIADNMRFKHIQLTNMEKIDKDGSSSRYRGYSSTRESYEEIYRKVTKTYSDPSTKQFNPELLPGDDVATGIEEMDSATRYWDDDFAAVHAVSRIIDHVRGGSNRGIGSIPAGMIERITADETPDYDYMEALRCFRHSVISSAKKLTRMRPSRRYGYEQMGSISQYQANVLVVCDASGSMTTPILNKFLGFCNGFFRYGVSSIDVVTFDTVVYDDSLTSLKRKTYSFDCHGRGGTIIDDILVYVNERAKKKYDGIVIFTDGGYSFDVNKWKKESGQKEYIFCVTEDSCFESHKKALDENPSPNIKITYIDINE